MPVRLRRQLEEQPQQLAQPAQPRVRMRGPQQGVPGFEPGPQGQSGFGALGTGVVRGFAGMAQTARDFGAPQTGAFNTSLEALESAAQRPIEPGLGNTALSVIGEASPVTALTAPLGLAARGGASLTALGAGSGAIGGVTRFSDRKLSPRERGLLATRGAVLGGVLGAAGGVLLRSMRGERDLFDRGVQISERLNIDEVPFAARRVAGVRMFGRQSQTGPTSAGEFASKAGKAVEDKILTNASLRKSIIDQMKAKESVGWMRFNDLADLDAPMDMNLLLKTTNELLEKPEFLTRGVKEQVRRLNKMAEEALIKPDTTKKVITATRTFNRPVKAKPVSYADLNEQRMLLGDAFGTDEAIKTIPIAQRNKLYAAIRETQKNATPKQGVTLDESRAAFEEAMAISKQIRKGEQVLHEIMSKKTATGVSNVQTGSTKKFDLNDLRAAYEADNRIKEIINYAQRARMPFPGLAFTDEGLVRPVARGQRIPVGVTGTAGAFGQQPEPILGAGAVGLNFLRESFRSPPTEGTSIRMPNVPIPNQ